MTNPIDNEELFDVISLGGIASPGILRSISGHDIEAKWDSKEASGQKGATTTLKGFPPRTITCTFYLADVEDFNAWPVFQAIIESTVNGPSPKAIEIYHPDLASQHITSVCQGKISGPQHDGKGGQTRVVTFQEYFPPKKAGGTPSGSVAKPKNDPNQAALDELAKLTKKYEETPWG